MIASERLVDLGGKGLNQAILLARAGCAVKLVAAVGADAFGARARALVERELPGSHLTTVDAPSDQSIIVVALDGENQIVSSASAADALDEETALGALGEIAEHDTILVQGNLTADTTKAALVAGRAAGAWTVANPSPMRWSWDGLLPLCDLVVVNRSELTDLVATVDATPDVLRQKGAGAALQTLGDAGARYADEHGVTSVPAVPVAVVDSAGAGDTFLAVFVAGRLSGIGVSHALRAAGQAAGITVSRRGTSSAFPTRAEIACCLDTSGAAE